MDYKCPLDGFSLLSDYDDENFSYTCPSCSALYLIPQGQPNLNRLKEIESQALSKLEKYKNRLEEIKKEEGNIIKIFEFTKKSGLLSKLNKANLSAKETKVVKIKDYQSKKDKEIFKRFISLSDHLV